MEQGLKTTLEPAPDPADVRFLDARLLEYNLQYADADNLAPLAAFLRDAQGEIVGGLAGGTYWGWLHIDVLWIREGLRGAGHGRRLLRLAEQEAARRGCHSAHVETHSFQSLSFYEGQGYTVYGQLADFPKPHTKYFLHKAL
jgi:ribosomal protein S18 acetylase RimI-like enzyme